MANDSTKRFAPVEVDVSEWPVVVVTPPPEPANEPMLEAFMNDWVTKTRHRAGSYVCVLDLRRSGHMSPAQRRTLTDWMNKSRDGLARTCLGTALIFDSALLRAMLTAVFWAFRPPYPTQVFSTRHEAIGWAKLRTQNQPLLST